MTGTGFYEQKSVRPGGLALVIAMHAAAFAGLVLLRTEIVARESPITTMFDVSPPRPVEEPPPEPRRVEPREQPSVLDNFPPIVETVPSGPTVTERPLPPLPPLGNPGEQIRLAEAAPELPPPPPVRVEAQFDPRYASELLPPYPAAEERAQRNGVVRVRVTVGADGRVKAIEKVNATSDAFWRATERHALARWRFRPATLDGRPVESRKVMNVHFRIEG